MVVDGCVKPSLFSPSTTCIDNSTYFLLTLAVHLSLADRDSLHSHQMETLSYAHIHKLPGYFVL